MPLRDENRYYLSGATTMNVKTIGIDLAKYLFQLHGVDQHGKAILTRQLNCEHSPGLVGSEYRY